MLDKSIKVNLLLPRSLWKALALASAAVGKSRAEFARTTLMAACAGQSAKGYPLSPTPSQPTRQPAETFIRPEPEPQYEEPPLRVATREDARHGEVTVSNFIVPLNWIDGEGNTRQQNLANGVNEYDGIYYTPPPLPKADADVPPDENTNGVAH